MKSDNQANKVALKKTVKNSLGKMPRYKNPEPWVRQGQHVQLGTPGREKRYITVGLDFGTAFTKASVGLMDKVHIVDWAGIIDSQNPYTLPCEFSVLGNNYCVIGHSTKARQVFGQLKHPFLEGDPSHEQITRGAVFIALILRYVRAWLFYNHGILIENKKSIWSLNIGLPSKPFDSASLKPIYERMAHAAWGLSSQSKPVTLQGARLAIANTPYSHSDELEAVNVIPEFVAQIASYINSPQRQSDLHMIIDVGAGTVDVATFNVHEHDGENVFPIFSSEIKPLGTHFLNESRFNLLTLNNPVDWDDFSPIQSALDFSRKYKVDLSSVVDSDNKHSRQVSNIINCVLHHTHTNRYRLSPKWGTGIRVFFCGGGSNCEAFQQALKYSSDSPKFKFRITQLPFPENTEAKKLNEIDFHRVAVAYGLGINAMNLGTIRPASEIEDDKPVQKRVWERPDRDELYPK